MKHHDPKYSNLEPLPNHRFLSIGEATRVGDMAWQSGIGPWIELNEAQLSLTKVVGANNAPICRRIVKENLVLKLSTFYPDNFRLDDGMVAFRIVEQFGFKQCISYKATNGIIIRSANTPALSDSEFWIRGNKKEDDDITIVTTREKYQKLCEAVEEILERKNAPKIIKRVTFLYTDKRIVVDVTDESETLIFGYNADLPRKNGVKTYEKRDIVGDMENVVKA